MQQDDKLKNLTIALYAIGVIYLFGVPILMMGFDASGLDLAAQATGIRTDDHGCVRHTGGIPHNGGEKSPGTCQPDSGSPSGRTSSMGES